MSALFVVRYKGQLVRFDAENKFAAEDVSQASSFISEADAWYMAYQAGLSPQFTDVESANPKEVK